jgi:chromosome segregation ATPase
MHLTEAQLRKLNQERNGGYLEEKLKSKGVWDRLGTELQDEIRYWKNLLINENKENESKKLDVLFYCREIKKLEEKVETLRNRGDRYKNELAQFKDRVYRLLGSSPEIWENLENRGGNLVHQIESLNIQVRNLKTQKQTLQDTLQAEQRYINILKTELDTSKKNKDEKILQLGNKNLLLQNKNKNQSEVYSRLENQISIIQQLAEVEIVILESEKNNFRNKFGKTSKNFKNYKKSSKKLASEAASEIKQLKHYLQKRQSLWKSEKKKINYKDFIANK